MAPFAKSLGGGAITVGVILAAQAFGETLGTIAFSRFVRPAVRLRLIGPLGVAACGVLVLFAIKPWLVSALLILAVSGARASYRWQLTPLLGAVTPEQRSQAFGLTQGGVSLGPGRPWSWRGGLGPCRSLWRHCDCRCIWCGPGDRHGPELASGTTIRQRDKPSPACDAIPVPPPLASRPLGQATTFTFEVPLELGPVSRPGSGALFTSATPGWPKAA